jgi:hypothetical protein
VENKKKTHRWLSIPEQSPIDFGEPFMLLDLTCPALASQSRELVLVKQLDDDVLARSRIRPQSRQLIVQITAQAEASSEPTPIGTINTARSSYIIR